MKYVAFYFFLVLAAVIAIGRSISFAPEPAVVWGAGGAFLAAGWIFAGRARVYGACVVLACITLGWGMGLSSPNRILQECWRAAVTTFGEKTVALEGTAAEGRRAWTDGYGRARYSLTLTDVACIENDRGPTAAKARLLPGAVRVSGAQIGPLPAYGDRVRVTGVLDIPNGATNPAGFDWQKFLTTRGTYAIFFVKEIRVIGRSEGWRGVVYGVREKLIRAMDAALTPFTADISKAIFVGERSELDPDFRRALVTTGTIHLFAISGFNVGFVAVILFGLFGLLRLPDPFKSLLVLVLLAAYAVLVGNNSPVARAVVMGAFMIGANLLRTRVPALQALGIAGVLMLIVNPEQVFDPAFQLSFAAVAGLAVVVPLWGSLQDVRRARSDRRVKRWTAMLTVTALTSLAATVTTGPILIHHFHRFSAVAPVINILLVPIAFGLNLLLIIFSALACLVPVAAVWIAKPIEWNVQALVEIVNVFERMPGASWNFAAWSPWAWAAFGVWWYWLARRKKDLRRWIRVTSTVGVFLMILLTDATRAAAFIPPLRVTFFDVGQANAALVELHPAGSAKTARILIDTGKGGDADAAGRVILPYLASTGTSKIDAVFITHPQFDHAGGLERLLNEGRIGGVWVNGDTADEVKFYDQALSAAKTRGVPVRTVKRGDRFSGLPGDARLQIFHHGPTSPPGDLNDHSLVIKLDAACKTFLWTGDIGEIGLSELLITHKFDPIDVLQVPHHGSKTGINELEFLHQVRPGISVISCGKNNTYGHPHPTTLEALQSLPTKIHRTDNSGALQLTILGDGGTDLKNY